MLIKVVCRSCGQETEVDAQRAFFFCPECGNKVVVSKEEPGVSESAGQIVIPEQEIVTEKLKEVAFYYKLSFDKREYEAQGDPTYYLKAQDLLVDLSQQFPGDYRIWWELAKPVDYLCVLAGIFVPEEYVIHADYFNKALDYAELSKKQMLIDLRDEYEKKKESIKEQEKKRLLEQAENLRRQEEAEKQRKEEDRRQAEERERQRRLQEEEQERQQRLQEEEAKRKAEEEKRQQEEEARKEAAESRKVFTEKRIAMYQESGALWEKLKNRDYSDLNNTYFSFQQLNNQTIVAIFQAASKALTIHAFRVDGNADNAVYKEQSMSVRFDVNGFGLKPNGTPIRIIGFPPAESALHVLGSPGNLRVNKLSLNLDEDYVNQIITTAKKSRMPMITVFF